jgi:hypothetical protein
VEDGSDSITFLGCTTQKAPVQIYSNANTAADEGASSEKAVARASSFLVASRVNLTAASLHPWNEAGGLLGLAGSGLARYLSPDGATLFDQLARNASVKSGGAAQRRQVVGLDFRSDQEAGRESALHLGGAHPDYPLQWAEPSLEASLSPSGVSTYRSLRLHFPSLCSAPLLGVESSSWPALLDTGSDCLVHTPPPVCREPRRNRELCVCQFLGTFRGPHSRWFLSVVPSEPACGAV